MEEASQSPEPIVIPISVYKSDFEYISTQLEKLIDGKKLDAASAVFLTYQAMKLIKNLPKLTDPQEMELLTAVLDSVIKKSNLSDSEKDVVLLVVTTVSPAVIYGAKDFTAFIKKRPWYKKLLRHFKKR